MKENKIVKWYSIINNLLLSGFLRLFIIVMIIYNYSQVYQGRLLQFIAIAGCFWAFESWFYEFRLSRLEGRLKEETGE